jgi:RND superfamily putative drug exporter
MNPHRGTISVSAVGRWSAAHPWRAIALWVIFVGLAVGALALTGTKQLKNGAVGESGRGYSLLDKHHEWPHPHEFAYVHSDALEAGDSVFRSATADVAARMRAIAGTNPTIDISPDGHSALVAVVMPRLVDYSALRGSVLAARPAHPEVSIQESSEISAQNARDTTVNRDLRRAELLSIPMTLLILLLAFGAGVAALVPVVLGLSAVVAAFGLLGPISQIFALDTSVKTIVLLIGMAVGVDYALFYVIRSREERSHGLSPHDALERTARTSGRTVLISGATVAIAMAGVYVVGSGVLDSIASGTIAVVACAVAASVTVLPAVLELLGARIDRGRIPFLRQLRGGRQQLRFWPAVVDRVLRRPLLSAGLAVGLLAALAVPGLGIHLSNPSDDALASNKAPAIATLARVRSEFPGTAAPALVAATVPAGERAAFKQATTKLETLARARGIAHPPFTVTESRDGSGASIELPLTGAGNNTTSRTAVTALRDDLVPRTLGRIPGVQTAVTGDAASDLDLTSQMKRGTPYVIAFVLTLAFVLLLATFRSLVIPLKAIVLNLLSVGAAYGVLVLVFQHHWAQGLLGFHSDGAIIAWLPLFLFVVLFGLSMDYHVFILSRVREAVDAGMSTDGAVRYAITRTAGVVTSAALVMVGVFSLFASLSSLDLKQAGVGLATAVLIDATVVRAVLLPATMTLLGGWNWYLPRWLEWLPGAEPGALDGRAHPPADRPPALPAPAAGGE